MRKRPPWPLLAIGLAICALVLAPLVAVVLGSCIDARVIGASTDTWNSDHDTVVSFAAYAYLLEHYRSWLLYSLGLALACVAVCMVVAVPAAYVLVRKPFMGSRLLEAAAALPLSLPGIAMSVAILAAYPTLRGWKLVLAGHLLYTIPFMLRSACVALRADDLVGMEAAARTLGAGTIARWRWVILPQLRHAITLGSLMVFAISWGEFNVSYLLNRGTPQTFPSALYDTFANESFQRAGAATVLFLAVLIPVTLLLQKIGGRRGNVEQAA